MTTHFRKHIRLTNFDYRSNHAYFVTIVTTGRKRVFGSITDGLVRPTQRGLIAEKTWFDLTNHHPFIELDAFIVMPNHVHGIVCFVGSEPDKFSPAHGRLTPRSIGAVIGSYKSAVTRIINRLRPGAAANLWQPNFYEHVIRNDRAMDRIREYIETNPLRWGDDYENVAGTRNDRVDGFSRSLLAEVQKTPEKGDAGVAAT